MKKLVTVHITVEPNPICWPWESSHMVYREWVDESELDVFVETIVRPIVKNTFEHNKHYKEKSGIGYF